ncbi:hypothetical protein Bbelb_432020 [Branchiostoma belcheri]|nr:hypothetical protein Bbelb_432020 [Branchiostoma belcheri]
MVQTQALPGRGCVAGKCLFGSCQVWQVQAGWGHTWAQLSLLLLQQHTHITSSTTANILDQGRRGSGLLSTVPKGMVLEGGAHPSSVIAFNLPNQSQEPFYTWDSWGPGDRRATLACQLKIALSSASRSLVEAKHSALFELITMMFPLVETASDPRCLVEAAPRLEKARDRR